MRKNLLSTSAMIGLTFAIGISQSSYAINHQAPQVKISGKTSVSMYMFKSDYKNQDEQKNNTYKITSRVESSRLDFNAKGSTEAFGGIDYSLLIGLSGDKNQQNTARETRIRIENPSYGMISFGNTKGPDKFKKMGASRIMGAMGGFNGSLKNIISATSGVLWSTDLIGSPKDAVKIVYYSPIIEGFQFGLSFTPNTKQDGSAKFKDQYINEKTPVQKNNWVGQISYENSFNNGTSIGISLTGTIGNSQDMLGKNNKNKVITYNQLENAASWAIGGQIGYQDGR